MSIYSLDFVLPIQEKSKRIYFVLFDVYAIMLTTYISTWEVLICYEVSLSLFEMKSHFFLSKEEKYQSKKKD